MSFISNLYSKLVQPQGKSGSHDTQRRSNTFTQNGANAVMGEDYVSEDGFVVLCSNTQPVKRCKVTEMELQGTTEKIEYQQTSPTSYPSGSHWSSPPSWSSEMARRGPQPAVEKSFMTVSDVPMELSKSLQTVFNMDPLLADCSSSLTPNIDQYYYDFSFERSVVAAIDSHISTVNCCQT